MQSTHFRREYRSIVPIWRSGNDRFFLLETLFQNVTGVDNTRNKWSACDLGKRDKQNYFVRHFSFFLSFFLSFFHLFSFFLSFFNHLITVLSRVAWRPWVSKIRLVVKKEYIYKCLCVCVWDYSPLKTRYAGKDSLIFCCFSILTIFISFF